MKYPMGSVVGAYILIRKGEKNLVHLFFMNDPNNTTPNTAAARGKKRLIELELIGIRYIARKKEITTKIPTKIRNRIGLYSVFF